MKSLVQSVLRKYSPNSRENLIPVLQDVQKKEGYISSEAINSISRYLRVSKSQVYGVASFYSQFKFNPPGRTSVKICLGTACHVRGAQILCEELERKLGIKDGETTPDLEYSLDSVKCLGACALGPVIIVNDKYHGQMNINKTQMLLEESNDKKEVEES